MATDVGWWMVSSMTSSTAFTTQEWNDGRVTPDELDEDRRFVMNLARAANPIACDR
jgi:hypothetical protein